MKNLFVYSASAGSGKTYTIAYEYISMMLKSVEEQKNAVGNDNSYRNILAVTFTNKACEEMKSRIVNNLFQIYSVNSMPPDKKEKIYDIVSSISKRTGLGHDEIIGRSEFFFKSIIHDYSFFSVFTIDSFFQKIVRNLTYELGIQQNYELELDTNLIILQLVDDLMLRAESDKQLGDLVGSLIEANIAKDNKWSPKSMLYNFFKQAVDADFKEVCFDVDAYESEKSILILDYCRAFRNCIDKVRKYIETNNLTEEDFSASTSWNYKKLKKFLKDDCTESEYCDIIFKDYKKGMFNEGKWFTGNANPDISSELDSIISGLDDDRYPEFCTAYILKKNANLMRLLGVSMDLLRESLDRESIFLLSEIPSFLSQLIVEPSNGSAGVSVMPFVFEKVGVRFNNFMIDEFQDTSRKQWDIFKAMLHDALSQGCDSIIVGDKKQSIYSWRGGDWRILSGIGSDCVLGPYVEPKPLKMNFRTAADIVNFNNDFFCKEYPLRNSDNDSVKSLYDDVKQEIKLTDDSAEVKVSLFSGTLSESDEAVSKCVFDDMLAEIEDLQLNYNVSPSKIMILVRAGKEASYIAGKFLEIPEEKRKQGVCYEVVSNEALFIVSNPAVRMIIAYMRYMLNPNAKMSLTEAAYLYFLEKNKLEKVSRFRKDTMVADLKNALSQGENLSDMQSFEIVEALISRLGLNKNPDNVPFLIAFRNVVHDFSDKSTDLQAFIDYWDERGANETLKIPESQNAIRIITIHKSKGLEADYIFIPFCNWKLIDGNFGSVDYLFYEEKDDKGNVIARLPIENNESLTKACSEMSQLYNDDRDRKMIESFNLLYVAFTRAKYGLYVSAYEAKSDDEVQNTPKKKKSAEKPKELKTVSDLLDDYFSKPADKLDENDLRKQICRDSKQVTIGDEKINVEIYRLGKRHQAKALIFNDGFITDYPVCEKPAARIVQHLHEDVEGDLSARLRGTKYHTVFEHIVTADDVEPSVAMLLDNGEIDRQEYETIASEIREAISQDVLKRLFDGSGKVYNEFNIIDPNSDGDIMKRPDRVVEFADEVVILDYKFGEERNIKKYSNQVRNYARLIKAMKPFAAKDVSAYIWYYFANELVKVDLSDNIN